MCLSKDIQLSRLNESMKKEIREIKEKYYALKKNIRNKKNNKIEWTILV